MSTKPDAKRDLDSLRVCQQTRERIAELEVLHDELIDQPQMRQEEQSDLWMRRWATRSLVGAKVAKE